MTAFLNDPYTRNLLKYIGTMLVGALAAGLGVLMAQLAGTDPIAWRPVYAAALGPIVTGLLARQLTKGGREDIGNLVTRVGPQQAKAALENEATRQIAGGGTDRPFTPTQVDQIAARLLELEAEHRPEPIDPTTPRGRATLDALDLPDPTAEHRRG